MIYPSETGFCDGYVEITYGIGFLSWNLIPLIIKFEAICNIFIRTIFWENETEQIELDIIVLLHFSS